MIKIQTLKISLIVIVLSSSLACPFVGSEQKEKLEEKSGISCLQFFPEIEKLNKVIEEMGFSKLSENGFFVLGGHGYKKVKSTNIRIGGLGGRWAGRKESKGKETEWDLGMGGFTLSYEINKNKFAFPLTFLVGGGGFELHLTDANNITRYQGGSFCIGGLSGLKYTITDVVSLQLDIGYLFPLIGGGDWTGAKKSLGENVNFEFKGPLIHFGVSFSLPCCKKNC